TLRECALRAARRGGVEVETERRQFLYCATLRQSIACMLLGVSPSEADAAERLDQALGSVSDWLDEAQRVDAKGVACWDECDLDIAFHLRRAYYALYAKNGEGKRVVGGDERYWVGRIIKALKLL